MATIRNVLPDRPYYFKMSARNNKGYGPPGPISTFKTAPAIVNPDYNMARASNEESSSDETISPIGESVR